MVKKRSGKANIPKKMVADINDVFGERKTEIVGAVSRAVYQKIATSSRRECLTFVSVDSKGAPVRTLSPSTSKDYLTALIAFCRKVEWNNRKLDSGLSAPVANTVAEEFSRQIQDQSGEVIEKIIPKLIHSEKFLNGLSEALWDSYRGSIPTHLQSKLTDALTVQLKTVLSTQLDQQTAATIKTAAAHAAGSISAPLAAKISIIIIQSLSSKLGPIIAKVLSSAALKAAVLAKIKALVGAAMIGGLVHLIGAKLTMLGVGSIPALWILAPIFLAWFANEARRLPRKLADKVSEAVRVDLDRNFPDLTKTVAEKITHFLMTKATGSIAKHLIKDEAISELLDDVLSEAPES